MRAPPLSRRSFGIWTAGLALASRDSAAQAVWPQPGRPIRLLVGLAAGGSLDGQARAIAQRLTELAGVQVIVDNKPGASMMLSAQEVMRAAPDLIRFSKFSGGYVPTARSPK